MRFIPTRTQAWCALVCLFLGAGAHAQEFAPEVKVRWSPYSAHQGLLAATKIRLETAVGVLEIPVARIRSISQRDSEHEVKVGPDRLAGLLPEGDLVMLERGKMIRKPWRELKELEMVDPRPPRGLTVDEVLREGSPPPVDEPADPPADPADDPEAPENVLAPRYEVSLDSTIGALVSSKDGAWIYVLNLSDARLHRLDAASGALASEYVSLADGTVAMGLDSAGKLLYTAAEVPETRADTPPPKKDAKQKGAKKKDAKQQEPERPILGKIEVIDLETFSVSKTMSIDLKPASIGGDAKGRLIVSGRSAAPECVAAIDPARGSIVARWKDAGYGAPMAMHPDGERLYFAEQDDLHCLRLPKDLKLAPTKYDSPYHHDAPAKLRAPFLYAADGRFLVTCTGLLLRLGASKTDDLRVLGQVAPHAVAAWDSARERLWLATRAGELQAWTLDPPSLEASRLIGVCPYRAHLDVQRRLLWCAVRREGNPETVAAEDPAPAGGVGNLLAFDLSFAD